MSTERHIKLGRLHEAREKLSAAETEAESHRQSLWIAITPDPCATYADLDPGQIERLSSSLVKSIRTAQNLQRAIIDLEADLGV